MSFEVDWGDIKKPSKTKQTKTTKKASNDGFEVDWGDLSKEPKAKHDFSSWYQKNFVEPWNATQGRTALETAGNRVQHYINEPIERLGLPSFARGVFQGGENLIRGVGNIPADIFNIQPKNFPGTQQQIYPIPHTEFPGPQGVNPYVQQGAGIAGNIAGSLPIGKGYQAIKTGLEHLPKAKMVPELIKNLIAGSTTGAALAPDNRALGAGLGAAAEVVPAGYNAAKNFMAKRNPGLQSKNLMQAELDLAHQKAAEKEAKELAKDEHGLNTPEALERSANKQERSFKASQRRQEEYNQEHKMLPGEQTVPEAKFGASNVDNVLRQTLGEGQPHSLQLSERISNAIEGVPTMEPHPVTGYPREVRKGGLREEIGSQYDKLADTFPENIKLPDKVDVAGIQKEFDKFLKDFPGIAENTKEEFRQLAAKTHPKIPGEEIKPKAFFRAYRAMKQQEGALRSKARTFGTSLADAEILNNKADTLKHTYGEMQNIIEQHFPKDAIKELHRINHEYSTLVAPLNKNPVYLDMLKSGNISGNILEKISGKEKGNAILRNMIMQDPELSRMALGHSYAENPEKLLKPNETIQPYIQANPQVAELLGLQRQAATNLETAKQNELVVKQFENLPKLRAEFNRKRAMAAKLREEAEATGLSQAEVIKRKEAYEEAKRKLNGFIKKSIGLGIGSTATGYIIHKLLD